MWPMVTFVYRTVQRWRRRESEGFSTVKQCYEIVYNTLVVYIQTVFVDIKSNSTGSFSILAKIRSYMYLNYTDKLYRLIHNC